jgi:predicted phosphodiesterase
METNEKRIHYKSSEPIYISGLGDIHWGNSCVDEKTFDKAIKWICDNKCYVVGMGDMIDGINIDDTRFDIKAITPNHRNELDNLISEQYETLLEKLKEIPTEQWIGIHTGNHEEKVRLRYYRDITRDLCRNLKTTYLGYEAWTRLAFERGTALSKHVEVFKLFSTHGSGGARYNATKLGKVERVCDKLNLDLFMMGHVHSLQVGRDVKETINVTGSVEPVLNTYAWMITGTFLQKSGKGVTSYAERMNLPSTKTGIGTFEIYPEERRIHVSI